MKPRNKTVISAGILAIIIFLFAYYTYNHLSDFKALANAGLSNIGWIIVLGLFLLINLFLNGFLLDVLMRPFGLKLKLKEALGLSIITNFYNTILPARGGMAARALYLKKKHNFAIVHFLATLSAIYVLIFLIGGILGILSMTLIYFNYGIFNLPILLLFLAITFGMLGIIIFSPKFNEPKNKWLGRFVKVINGWHLIKKNKKIVLSTLAISLIQLMITSISFIIAYHIFNINLGILQAVFISSVNSIAILVAVTPGNLGIGDAINVFSATIVGIDLTNAVAATILIRVIGLILILILGPIFSYYLMRGLKDKEPKYEPTQP